MIIKRTRANIRIIRGITFYPGTNKVSDADGESLQNDESFLREIEAGYLQIVDAKRSARIVEDDDEKDIGKSVNEAQDFADEVSNIRASDAISIIKDTLRVDFLEALEKIETRKSVLRAVSNQIEELTEEEEKEEEEEDIGDIENDENIDTADESLGDVR